MPGREWGRRWVEEKDAEEGEVLNHDTKRAQMAVASCPAAMLAHAEPHLVPVEIMRWFRRPCQRGILARYILKEALQSILANNVDFVHPINLVLKVFINISCNVFFCLQHSTWRTMVPARDGEVSLPIRIIGFIENLGVGMDYRAQRYKEQSKWYARRQIFNVSQIEILNNERMSFHQILRWILNWIHRPWHKSLLLCVHKHVQDQPHGPATSPLYATIF